MANSVSAPAQRIEQAIRSYIQACNGANADVIAAHFTREATHYAPGVSKWVGAGTIGDNFAKRVKQTGQWWTVDQVLTDADRCAGALEWTRFDPSNRQIVRGVDWFVFDPKTFLISEVRPYLATRPNPEVARHELLDFDYAARGYPTAFPD